MKLYEYNFYFTQKKKKERKKIPIPHDLLQKGKLIKVLLIFHKVTKGWLIKMKGIILRKIYIFWIFIFSFFFLTSIYRIVETFFKFEFFIFLARQHNILKLLSEKKIFTVHKY